MTTYIKIPFSGSLTLKHEGYPDKSTRHALGEQVIDALENAIKMENPCLPKEVVGVQLKIEVDWIGKVGTHKPPRKIRKKS